MNDGAPKPKDPWGLFVVQRIAMLVDALELGRQGRLDEAREAINGLFGLAAQVYESRCDDLPQVERDLVDALWEELVLPSDPERRGSLIALFGLMAVAATRGFLPSEFLFSFFKSQRRKVNPAADWESESATVVPVYEWEYSFTYDRPPGTEAPELPEVAETSDDPSHPPYRFHFSPDPGSHAVYLDPSDFLLVSEADDATNFRLVFRTEDVRPVSGPKRRLLLGPGQTVPKDASGNPVAAQDLDQIDIDHETAFWIAVLDEELSDGGVSPGRASLYARALAGPLTRKMRLNCLLGKVLADTFLQEWDQALNAIRQLLALARNDSFKRVLYELRGMVECLRIHGIKPKQFPRLSLGWDELAEDDSTSVTVLDQAEEVAQFAAAGFPSSLVDSIIQRHSERIRRLVQEDRELTIGMINDARPETPDKVAEKLCRSQGEWLKELANSGALFNAEYLYETLSRRSWGEVVAGYSNAVEAEVKRRIMGPLRKFLEARQGRATVWLGTTRGVLPGDIEVSDRCDLFDLERLLRAADSNAYLKDFFSAHSAPVRDFLLSKMPGYLAHLRGLRNPAVHGRVIASVQDVKELREQTLEVLKLLSAMTAPGR
ncbi:MAG: hypothetical protein HY673_10220 [Chloroflexi bacterium]|nr:hypothetical protein [Chloroflexota bacterium]